MAITRQTVSALVLSSLLVMGACNRKDKGSADNNFHDFSELPIAQVSKNQITDLMTVKARDVDDVNAQTALKQFALFESGSDGVSWETRTGEKGNYVFTGLHSKNAAGAITRIDTLKLQGVRMEGENASFDRMDISDMSVANPQVENIEGDSGAAIKANDVYADVVSVAYPQTSFAPNFVKSIVRNDVIDEARYAAESSGEHLPVGGLWLEGLKVGNDERSISLANFGWAENLDAGKAIFKLDNLAMNLESKGQTLKMSIESVDALGIDVSYLLNIPRRAYASADINRPHINIIEINPFKNNFEDMAIKDLKMDFQGIEMKVSRVTANTREKNAVTTIYLEAQPISFGISEVTNDPNVKAFKDTLNKLGYDQLEFTASQIERRDEANDTSSITDARVAMKEGFELKYSYTATGIKAYAQKMELASNDATKAEDALSEMKLKYADITLIDQSLLDRMIKSIAAERGISEDMLRTQAKSATAVLTMGAKNEAEAKVYAQMSEALGKFIESGGSLHIKLLPKTPVPFNFFDQSSRLQANIDDLGLTFEHKAK